MNYRISITSLLFWVSIPDSASTLVSMKLTLDRMRYIFSLIQRCWPAGVVVKNAAFAEGSFWFDSRAGQSRHSDTNRSPPLLRFYEAVLPKCPGVKLQRWTTPLVTSFGRILKIQKYPSEKLKKKKFRKILYPSEKYQK